MFVLSIVLVLLTLIGTLNSNQPSYESYPFPELVELDVREN